MQQYVVQMQIKVIYNGAISRWAAHDGLAYSLRRPAESSRLHAQTEVERNRAASRFYHTAEYTPESYRGSQKCLVSICRWLLHAVDFFKDVAFKRVVAPEGNLIGDTFHCRFLHFLRIIDLGQRTTFSLNNSGISERS